VFVSSYVGANTYALKSVDVQLSLKGLVASLVKVLAHDDLGGKLLGLVYFE
jgi:hypothetical protein